MALYGEAAMYENRVKKWGLRDQRVTKQIMF